METQQPRHRLVHLSTAGSLESQGSLHILPSTSLHLDASVPQPQQQPVCSPRQGRPPRKQAQHSRRSSLVFYFLLLIAASGPAIVLMNALLRTGSLGGGDSRVKIALPPGSPAAPAERLSWAQVAEAKRQAIKARSLSALPQRLIDGSSDVHAAPGATQGLAATSGRSDQGASTAGSTHHSSSYLGGHREGRSHHSRTQHKGIDYMAKALKGPHPMRLKYPVLWGGAFFSRSGGCMLGTGTAPSQSASQQKHGHQGSCSQLGCEDQCWGQIVLSVLHPQQGSAQYQDASHCHRPGGMQGCWLQ
jgi:hypothetical protein